ncbi:hypothetical protein D3C72_2229540 [compost metagenome]
MALTPAIQKGDSNPVTIRAPWIPMNQSRWAISRVISRAGRVSAPTIRGRNRAAMKSGRLIPNCCFNQSCSRLSDSMMNSSGTIS